MATAGYKLLWHHCDVGGKHSHQPRGKRVSAHSAGSRILIWWEQGKISPRWDFKWTQTYSFLTQVIPRRRITWWVQVCRYCPQSREGCSPRSARELLSTVFLRETVPLSRLEDDSPNAAQHSTPGTLFCRGAQEETMHWSFRSVESFPLPHTYFFWTTTRSS